MSEERNTQSEPLVAQEAAAEVVASTSREFVCEEAGEGVAAEAKAESAACDSAAAPAASAPAAAPASAQAAAAAPVQPAPAPAQSAASQAQPSRAPQQTYPQQSVYAQQQSYRPQSGYSQQGYRPQPGYAAQPAYFAPYPPQPAFAVSAAPAAPAAEPKKQRNWGRVIALTLLVMALVFVAFCMGSCAGMLSKTMDASLDPNGYALSTLNEDAIAVITLSGEIAYDGSSCSPEGFRSLLNQAEKNDHIKAVLIRVNSGGGSATAGEEMTAYLKDFSKPVVVSSASMNASAAYEISSQADYIFVNKSTEIGSIGTVIQFTDYSDLLDKLGIKSDNIASADSKDSSYGTRELTDEEREYYQNLVDQINEVFIENVAEGRNMSVDEVRKLATGLVFSGVDAVDNGIADEIGTRKDAADKAAELGGIKTEDYKEVSLTLSSPSSITSILDLLGSSNLDPAEIVDILEDGNHGGNAE